MVVIWRSWAQIYQDGSRHLLHAAFRRPLRHPALHPRSLAALCSQVGWRQLRFWLAAVASLWQRIPIPFASTSAILPGFYLFPFFLDYYRMARQFSGREAPHCGTIHQLHPVWLGFQPGCMLARCCTMEFSLIGFQKWPESNRKIIFQSVPFSFGFPSSFSVRTKWSAPDEPISQCEKKVSMDIQSSSNQPFTNFRWRDTRIRIYTYISWP